MKIVYIIILSFITCLTFAQEKVTKGLPNGYAWTAPLSVSTPVYAKDESLLASLQQRKYLSNIDSSLNKKTFPFDCEGYIDTLLSQGKSSSIDFKEVIKLIDDFYSVKENFVIPVLGAYCYSIKKITGTSVEKLEEYRNELLTFSLKKSEE